MQFSVPVSFSCHWRCHVSHTGCQVQGLKVTSILYNHGHKLLTIKFSPSEATSKKPLTMMHMVSRQVQTGFQAQHCKIRGANLAEGDPTTVKIQMKPLLGELVQCAIVLMPG